MARLFTLFSSYDVGFVCDAIQLVIEGLWILIYISIDFSALVSNEPKYYDHNVVAAKVKSCVDLYHLNLELSNEIQQHVLMLAKEPAYLGDGLLGEIQAYEKELGSLIEVVKPVYEVQASLTYDEKRAFCMSFQDTAKSINMSGFGNSFIIKEAALSDYITKMQKSLEDFTEKKRQLYQEAYTELYVLDSEGFPLKPTVWDKFASGVTTFLPGHNNRTAHFNISDLEQLLLLFQVLEMKNIKLPNNVVSDKTLLQFKYVHGNTVWMQSTREQEKFLEMKYKTIPKFYEENAKSLKVYAAYTEEMEKVIRFKLQALQQMFSPLIRMHQLTSRLMLQKQKLFDTLITAIHGRPMSFVKLGPQAQAISDAARKEAQEKAQYAK